MELPAGNDLSWIMARYGKDLVLLGNVDCSGVCLPKPTWPRCAPGWTTASLRLRLGGYMFVTNNPLDVACTFEAVVKIYSFGR